MSSGCGDVLSLEDLKIAKKHQLFEAEVITGKQGGVATGADIDYATNQVTGQVQKTLPAVLRDAGFRPASFTFDTGGTLGVNDADVAVLWPGPAGDGQYYVWRGALPKTIPASSTPEGTGGISDTAWVPFGDLTLRSDLASSAPGKGIDLVYDGAKESELNTLTTNVTDGVVYLRDYASLVTGGDDWTAAINAALATGKDVRGADGVTYKVSGVLKSKGQRLLGDWFINPIHVTHVTTVKADSTVQNPSKIRLIYVAVRYDLCELLVMKSLGFNMVSHYMNFASHTSGAGGTIQQLLDNAVTAGVRVHVDLQQAMTNNSLTMSQLVTLCDASDSTWGYSVYDEPASRDISVATQDAQITAMRALTGKPLTVVDLIVRSNPPFYQKLSFNYDYVFVDSYAQRYTSGTAQDKRDWDMEKSRLDVGGMTALTRNPNILYVGGLFIDHETTGQYTQDKQQGIDHCLNFLKNGGGEYGMFIWDAPWDSTGDDRVMNSTDYQNACVKLAEQAYCAKKRTQYYLFGSATNYADFGLGDLERNLPLKDPNNVQIIPWDNSYPANTFLNSTDKISGIGFKSVTANFATTIPCLKYVSVYLDTMSATGSIPAAATLQLKGWNGELTRSITPTFPIGTAPTFYNSSKYDGLSRNEQLVFTVTNGVTDTKYSLVLRGLVVCTEW